VSWKAELAAAVGARVAEAEPVSGGDINDAYRVRLDASPGFAGARSDAERVAKVDDKRIVFVKTHANPPAGMFDAEAHGLEWIRGPLRVPRVVASGTSFLALEWLDVGAKGKGFDAALGRGLAELHKRRAPSFGLERANYLATLPQDNTATDDGVAFWVEQRLRPLARRARLDVDAQLDRLRARPDRFGPKEPPARLHGDLWWGNVIAVDGVPVLIDPAVYGGHREVDLAMLALFGGVSPTLVDAYCEAFPLAEGWRDRVGLWQLYPLAAHAALFGGGYGAQFARVLATLTTP
jgi:fructosamine-3-kinase